MKRLKEVKSSEELDGLPPGAVVLEHGFAWQKAGNGFWYGYMDGCSRNLPAVTLYRGKRGKIEVLHREPGFRRIG